MPLPVLDQEGPMNTKRWMLFALTSFTLAVLSTSFAAGGGGGGGGGAGAGAGMGAGGGHGSAMGAASGKAGGTSASHMGATAVKNSNSPISGDRDKGLARAADRSDVQADRSSPTDQDAPSAKHVGKTTRARTHHHSIVRKSTPSTDAS